MAITWTISQLTRDLSDGLVTNAYWICNVTDGNLSASNSGSVGFERGNTFTPYENLTQEQVLAWVQSQLNVSEIEAGLQSHIDALKTPVSATGVPW